MSNNSNPAYNKTQQRGALGIGYNNFNYKQFTVNTSEASIELTDLEGNAIEARAVTLYSTVACSFGLDQSVADYDNEPQLPATTFFSISKRVQRVYGKAASSGTLRIYYVW